MLLTTLDDNHLPFLELGVTPGVARNYLSNTINASSLGIAIPGGFAIGTTTQRLVYVSVESPMLLLSCND